MLYELKGETLSVAVNSFGAELWRLETNDEPERPLLWSGDPAVWPGRAPLLFPWCGAVENGWFQVNGKRYAAPRKHGFARDMEHTLQAQTKHSLTFRLDWLEDRERFPWSCSLTSRFSLEGQRLTVDCTTINNSRTPMPVQMGFHPAFRCPYTPGKTREDYIIRFEKPEIGCPDGIFALKHDSFSQDCVYFPKLRSDWIQLEEKIQEAVCRWTPQLGLTLFFGVCPASLALSVLSRGLAWREGAMIWPSVPEPSSWNREKAAAGHWVSK